MPESRKNLSMNSRWNSPGLSCRLNYLTGWLAGLLLLLSPLPLFANEVSPSLIAADTTVSQREVTVGDIVTYSITVTHEPDQIGRAHV